MMPLTTSQGSLDLQSGYWQVELAPDARPKNAFTIGQGLWQFRVMPFGLCNTPATFERLMERIKVQRQRQKGWWRGCLPSCCQGDQPVHTCCLRARRGCGQTTEVVYRVRRPGRGRMLMLHQDRLPPPRLLLRMGVAAAYFATFSVILHECTLSEPKVACSLYLYSSIMSTLTPWMKTGVMS